MGEVKQEQGKVEVWERQACEHEEELQALEEDRNHAKRKAKGLQQECTRWAEEFSEAQAWKRRRSYSQRSPLSSRRHWTVLNSWCTGRCLGGAVGRKRASRPSLRVVFRRAGRRRILPH